MDAFITLEEVDYSRDKAMLFRRLLGYVTRSSSKQQGPWPPITLHEAILRTAIVVDNHIVMWATVDALHHALAIFFVTTGIDLPEEWPPLFGNIIEAYSIRRWWSRFWHSLVHRMLSGYASFVLCEVLLIREKTTFSHLSHNFLVFLISGAYHGIVYRYSTPQCHDTVAINYYLMQPLGLLIETVVQTAWQKWRRKLAFRETLAELISTRLLGYIWVFTWFFWLVPEFAFAHYRCEDPILID